jgi:hypothetical protein
MASGRSGAFVDEPAADDVWVVPEVFADAEGGGSRAEVAPLAEGGDRDAEEGRDLLDGPEAVACRWIVVLSDRRDLAVCRSIEITVLSGNIDCPMSPPNLLRSHLDSWPGLAPS